MTWKELKDKISLMTEEEQRQEVAVWGENMNLMKDCSLEKTDEDMYYNSEWDYTCEESDMGILEENRTFISSRPGCILCRLDEMESWAYLDDLLP